MDMIATSALEKKADNNRQAKIMTKYKLCEPSIYTPGPLPEHVYHTIGYVHSQRAGALMQNKKAMQNARKW
jgi:hypothetical protein